MLTKIHTVKAMVFPVIMYGCENWTIKKAEDQRIDVFKSRDIIKAMVFPGVMCRCDSLTIKKIGCQRIDAFELWCWRRLESPLDCKEIQPANHKGNQS